MKFIKDEEFIRGKVPMTKEEVRILSIAKLELEKDDKMLDVGAGTGSISIQMSKFCKEVTAIERDEEAYELILQNKAKFGCNNLDIIKGEALEELQKLSSESFDGIFIGGTGGNLEKIIEEGHKILKQDGRVVLNFITLDNCYKACETLKKLNYKVDITEVHISKNRNNSYMMMSNNGIYIVSGRKEKIHE